MNDDSAYFVEGITDGQTGVDLRDGTHAITQDYETVRLPDDLGGHWVVVESSRYCEIGGLLGIHYTLAHDEIDVIVMIEGEPQQYWIRKTAEEEE